MGFCFVKGCANSSNNRENKKPQSDISFYKIPKKLLSRFRAFKRAGGREDSFKFTDHTKICSAHFVGGHKSDDPKSPSYLPTLHVPFQPVASEFDDQVPPPIFGSIGTRKRRAETRSPPLSPTDINITVTPKRKSYEPNEVLPIINH